jgi:fumarate reductase iron-sulfur subunit
MSGEHPARQEGHETERAAMAINNLLRREIQTPLATCLLRGFVAALGDENALKIASIAIQEEGSRTGKMMTERYGGNSMADLLRVVREVWAEDGALEFDILETTEDRLSFNVTRCRYAELYDRLGVKEFGYCLSCNRDAPLIKGYNPRMRLDRTQTIMEGAEYCDFRIVLEQSRPNE